MSAHVISSGTFLIFAIFAAPSWIHWNVFWPYFAGVMVLAFGVPKTGKELAATRGLDKMVTFGPLFFAIPMAVFGAQHFTAAHFVARMVPSWIPWHLFWIYFVGTALIAAALSIVTGKQAWLSAGLLGLMLFLFVVLMHIPTLLRKPFDRIQLAVVFRDLSFSGGALAYAGAQTSVWRARGKHALLTTARFFIAVPVLVFAVEQFRHPNFVPAVPLAKVTPAWIPGHLFWSYFAAVAFVPAGLALILNIRAHKAATWLGMVVLLTVLFVYLPIEIANPGDVANALNYFVDTLAFGAAALLLAAALPAKQRATPVEVDNRLGPENVS
jgi:uncharacterized membrane protein